MKPAAIILLFFTLNFPALASDTGISFDDVAEAFRAAEPSKIPLTAWVL